MTLGRATLLALALVPFRARAQVATGVPAELTDVGIDEKPGAQLPPNLLLRDQEGRTVTLADYADGTMPVVLQLAYFRCPMLCSLVQNGLIEGLRSTAFNVGEKFRVITVSIDPSDTPAGAADKRRQQVAAYGRRVGPKGWDFLVGSEAEVKRLADTVGFHYRYDKDRKEYAHAAGVFVFTPDGRLSRTLYGINFPEKSMRLALLEASDGKLGSAWDKVLLFCYHYDPAAKSYAVAATRVMKLGGVLTMAGLAVLIALLTRDGHRHRPTERTA